nr:hypothetical protein [uncultured Halomonas sp.]
MRASIKVEAGFPAAAPIEYAVGKNVRFDRLDCAVNHRLSTAYIDFPRYSFVKNGITWRTGWLSTETHAVAGEDSGKNGYGRYLSVLTQEAL